MKIRCDLCDGAEASVFCSADEAALCEGCDHRVHFANKLASKHFRFSLLHASLKESPLCDICQERRAFLFCQEDRAILCKECDLPIHKASEHTRKHNRFLLTGVKLSPSSSLYPTSSSSNEANAKSVTKSHQPSSNKRCSDSNEIFSSPSVEKASPSVACNIDDYNSNDNCSISTSSISEYLQALPGWRVDDFLDPSFGAHGFSKTFDQNFPTVDQDLANFMCAFSPEDSSLSVPRVSHQVQTPLLPKNGLLDGPKEPKQANNLKVSRQWSDDWFTVPQISAPSLKKSRQLP
uniref:B box-type domain-containing protein n=1 Tax=Rhizophora mucronata TaxID=61149 RepID=A0A2P2ITN1_RHIMU